MVYANPYAESYAEGLTRRSYTKVLRKASFQWLMHENPSVTREPYAGALRGAPRNFLDKVLRGKPYASLTRRSYTGALREAIFQWRMLEHQCLTRRPCAEALREIFFR